MSYNSYLLIVKKGVVSNCQHKVEGVLHLIYSCKIAV